MSTKGRKRFLAGQKGSRRGAQGGPVRSRHLLMERLEERRLLSVDLPGWHNAVMPADVNNDGVVAPVDALLVVHELRASGARFLDPAPVSAASTPTETPTASADSTRASVSGTIPEGEQPSRVYIDVNGDNFLSAVDAFLVARALRAEGQTEMVRFRLETTDLGGTPISAVDQGDPFVLNVFVQDVRADTVADRGVFQAYVDVTFDDALLTAVGPFAFGASYQEQTSGDLALPGLVDEAGGTQTGFALPPDGPLGPGEFLLFSVPFEATAAGTVTFASDPADFPILHDVTLFEPTITVPAGDIIFGTTELTVNLGPVVAFPDQYTVDEDSLDNFFDVLTNDQINTAGTLAITGVGATDQGGTVVNNGDHLLYSPALNFAGTETFTYTIGDGLGNSDQETVTVTVLPQNDPPVALDDGGAQYTTDEDTPLTTGNVLDNDTDADGDPLAVFSFDTTGTKGLVTDNGDGTFGYDPNGQFDQLTIGQQATDTFTYTVTDGNDGFDTATVTITITAAPPTTGDVAGFVFADVDNDGARDGPERAIGDVEVRLAGTDVFGSPVARSTRTDAQGRYRFSGVLPGVYDVIEIQPRFFLDGIDAVGGVPYTGPNDRVRITPDMESPSVDVNFGERSLHPSFISVADSINTALRQGIVIGFDSQWNQLWYSVLDGWNGVTSVNATISGGGSTARLNVSYGAAVDLAFTVPTSPLQGWFRVMGETSGGRVVQFIGTRAQFQRPASGLTAEGEAEPNEELIDAVFAELG